MMISVITPVYNGEKFIEHCLQNVIDQACPNVEHIIMDGGSQDGTIEIVQQYAQRYHHIRWISQKDKGQSDALNQGIRIANSEVIGILNIDDLYHPKTLRLVSELFQDLPEPTLLAGNCLVWNQLDDRTWLSQPRNLTPIDLLSGRTHLINPVAYFYHASLHHSIGDYNVDEHYAMDLDFVLRAASVAHLHYVDQTLGEYRIYADTKTAIDEMAGLAAERKQHYLKLHTQNLPYHQQFAVHTVRNLRSLYAKIRTL